MRELIARIRHLIEATWTDIEDVMDVVDTNNLTGDEQYMLRNAAALRGRNIVGWHVTDNSRRMRQVVKKSGSIMKAYGSRGGTAELGPGLYMSAVPQVWVGRSTDKWSFLKELSKSDVKKLATSVEKDIDRMKDAGHISGSEAEYAYRDIGYVKSGQADADVLVRFAGMPYSVAFWKSDYLQRLGLQRGNKGPMVVEIRVQGKYAKIDRGHATHGALRTLRRGGFDGAFMSGGWSNEPQLVVWNTKAIKWVGKDEPYEE